MARLSAMNLSNKEVIGNNVVFVAFPQLSLSQVNPFNFFPFCTQRDVSKHVQFSQVNILFFFFFFVFEENYFRRGFVHTFILVHR